MIFLFEKYKLFRCFHYRIWLDRILFQLIAACFAFARNFEKTSKSCLIIKTLMMLHMLHFLIQNLFYLRRKNSYNFEYQLISVRRFSQFIVSSAIFFSSRNSSANRWAKSLWYWRRMKISNCCNWCYQMQIHMTFQKWWLFDEST